MADSIHSAQMHQSGPREPAEYVFRMYPVMGSTSPECRGFSGESSNWNAMLVPGQLNDFFYTVTREFARLAGFCARRT